MKNEAESFALFVGVDVSKSQLDVFLPDSKTRLTIDNSTDAIVRELVKVLKHKSRVLVVMEATGGYESTLVRVLGERQIAVAVVNPRQVRDFAKGIGRDAKTDSIDAEVIATFGQVVKPAPMVAKSEAEEKIAALVTRRAQLLDLINQESNRLLQTGDHEVKDYIRQTLESLKKQLKVLDSRLEKCVAADTVNAQGRNLELRAGSRRRHHQHDPRRPSRTGETESRADRQAGGRRADQSRLGNLEGTAFCDGRPRACATRSLHGHLGRHVPQRENPRTTNTYSLVAKPRSAGCLHAEAAHNPEHANQE